MLTVLSPEEASALIAEKIETVSDTETLPLSDCVGRVLAEDICASEYVPGFDRSTVDGYALRAADSFGCSDAIPALFTLSRSIGMGEAAGEALAPGCCAYVPTGAALPPGADAVAMIEYCEAFGDGTIALSKAV
ncbi:MAG: molybdopterin molybdenumtransferase MoeA, partial [Oscillospiraceae bacterium]|nr:molybdopterin molybdenumtransferase MoeA [Oscillospiraceae bacterium]